VKYLSIVISICVFTLPSYSYMLCHYSEWKFTSDPDIRPEYKWVLDWCMEYTSGNGDGFGSTIILGTGGGGGGGVLGNGPGTIIHPDDPNCEYYMEVEDIGFQTSESGRVQRWPSTVRWGNRFMVWGDVRVYNDNGDEMQDMVTCWAKLRFPGNGENEEYIIGPRVGLIGFGEFYHFSPERSTLSGHLPGSESDISWEFHAVSPLCDLSYDRGETIPTVLSGPHFESIQGWSFHGFHENNPIAIADCSGGRFRVQLSTGFTYSYTISESLWGILSQQISLTSSTSNTAQYLMCLPETETKKEIFTRDFDYSEVVRLSTYNWLGVRKTQSTYMIYKTVYGNPQFRENGMACDGTTLENCPD